MEPVSKKKGHVNKGFEGCDLTEVMDDREYWDDSFDEDKLIFSDDKKRSTYLIWNDFSITTLEYLQWLALIQSLSLRWPWPEGWVKSMVWVFGFNLDAWEISKVSNNMTYKSIQQYFTDSQLMPYSYWHVLVGWAVLVFLLVVIYLITYCVWMKQEHPLLLMKIAKMQQAYLIICQVLAFPLGLALGKVCHCATTINGKSLMYMDSGVDCLSDTHWIYIVVAATAVTAFFILVPVWIILKTKPEIIFNTSAGHEAHLQLKETEHVQGLDTVYVVNGFHIFSSFKLRASYFRAALHLIKFIAIIVYAALFFNSFYQAIILTGMMAVCMISFFILRPYRVSLFNVVLGVNYTCLTLNLLTGSLRTSLDVYSVRSVWFTPSYTTWTLILVNGLWLLFTLAVFIYLMLQQFNCISKTLWPTLTSSGEDELDDQTTKFMRGVIIARHVIEKSVSIHALFAPAHELSRQIQIINAYCREAELLSNPLQDTLWHLLDELIQVHSKVAPRSLFAESVKDTIRATASDLMRMMPQFSLRLAQREYDFLLMSPVKRRLLLKMYCLGLFVNGRTEKVLAKKVNEQALEQVWSTNRTRPGGKRASDTANTYMQVLQPETETVPTTLEYHQDNQQVDDLTSMFTDDSASLDVEQMMQGIPSRPHTSDIPNS